MRALAVISAVVMGQSPVFYHLQRQSFVRAFGDCLTDTECTIQYLHMFKTGGTFLETTMASMTRDWRATKSCCGNEVIEKFLESPQPYCDASFASYQVAPNDFRDIVLKTCQQTSSKKNVVLVTYREPVAWTVSFIHQLCNKNWHRRSERIRAMCKRCNYYDDPVAYDHLIGGRFLQVVKEILSDKNFKGPPPDRLALDNADLSSFLMELQNYLPPEYTRRLSGAVKNNVETTQLCDFKVPSKLIRALKPSLLLYRNLTLGLTGM